MPFLKSKPTCPVCRIVLDGVGHVTNEALMPKEGDATVCSYCMSLLIFTKNLSLRIATRKETKEIEKIKHFDASVQIAHAIGLPRRNRRRT